MAWTTVGEERVENGFFNCASSFIDLLRWIEPTSPSDNWFDAKKLICSLIG